MRGKSPTKPVPQMTPEQAAFFWDHVQKGEPDDCWVWRGRNNGNGYGIFWLEGVDYAAHRLSYALANGPLPAAPSMLHSVVMHRCDNPPCVNPGHLSHGTNRDNIADRQAKQRMRLPEIVDRISRGTKDGMARAALEGRVGGRRKVATPEKVSRAKALIAGGMSVQDAAAAVEVGMSTLYRELAKAA